MIEKSYPATEPGGQGITFFLRRPRKAAAGPAIVSLTGTEAAMKVSGVLMLPSQRDNLTLIRNEMKQDGNPYFKIADEHNLAVLSWARNENLERPASAEKEPASVTDAEELALKTWEKGALAMLAENKLSNKGAIIVGGVGASRIASRLPDMFNAAVIDAATAIPAIPQNARDTLWLVSTVEGHGSTERVVRCCLSAFKAKVPVVFLPISRPVWKSRDSIFRVHAAFLDYVLTIEKQFPAQSHEKIWTRDLLDEPQFLGDYVNHIVVTPRWDDWIPPGQRIAIPNRAIAQLFGEILE